MIIIGIMGVAFAATKLTEAITGMVRTNKENKTIGYRPVFLAAPSHLGMPEIRHDTALTATELRHITRGVDLTCPVRVAAAARFWQ